jgi:hypothetical protein
MSTIIIGAVCLVVGHFWGGTIWPWLKAKIWPAQAPLGTPPAEKP